MQGIRSGSSRYRATQSLSEGGIEGGCAVIHSLSRSATDKIEENQADPVAATSEREKRVSSSDIAGEEKPDKRGFKKYNVKWYETLEDVAVKFNVTVEAIVALNRIDLNSKKRVRTIYIPDERYIEELTAKKEASASSESAESSSGTSGEEISDSTFPATVFGLSSEKSMYAGEGENKISVVLPFNVSKGSENISAGIADFYSGMLLAVHDLQENGEFDKFRLEAVDLSGYPSGWSMLSAGVLDEAELIIGPISERDLHPVALYAKERKIPIVSPLDNGTKSLLQDNPYLFLFPPKAENSIARQVEKISMKRSADSVETIVVMYEKGYENSPDLREVADRLEERGMAYRVFSYSFMDGRGIEEAMRSSLDSLHLNKVIIPSNNEAFISDAMRNLDLIRTMKGYRIELYGMGKWKGYETLETSYFHDLSLRLSMAYHIDFNHSGTKEFVEKYTQVFHTEPTPWAYQGYDILTYFVRAMNQYGKAFPAHILYKKSDLIQSDVLFVPTEQGSGYENCALKDVIYRNGWIISEE